VSDVLPALTAEEWAHVENMKRGWPEWISENNEATLPFGSYEAQTQAERLDNPHHWIAALALYGQPFGFTREDVAIIYNAAWFVDLSSVPGRSQMLEDLRSLADRIESLLPPPSDSTRAQDE
jgi:hypothetical protein